MKTAKIKVTQEEIDNGKRYKAYLCPVALAFNRAGFDGSSVGIYSYMLKHIEVVHSGWATFKTVKFVSYYLPPLITDWVKTFDNGESVLPIEFKVNVDPNYKWNKEIN